MTNGINMKTTSKPKRAATTSTFVVNLGEGKTLAMETRVPYGAFISEVRKAKNYTELNELIGKEGFSMKSVKPLITYLDLPQDKFASLIGVSSRTISRWDNDSMIGVLASKTLLELDRLSKKGIDTFGDAELFKGWLKQPNVALGDVAPIDMLVEPYGVELVEDALAALEYGNIM
jgi:putative toxin-antitoxin system antitoxin component (TIGR02293 family)